MLLECIAADGIVQEVSEIRVEVEQRSSEEAIDFEGIAALEVFAVVTRKGSELHSAAIGRIDVAEAVQEASVHQIERELPRRIEIIATEQNSESELLVRAQIHGVIAVYI